MLKGIYVNEDMFFLGIGTWDTFGLISHIFYKHSTKSIVPLALLHRETLLVEFGIYQASLSSASMKTRPR